MKKITLYKLFFIVWTIIAVNTAFAQVSVNNLRCEMLTNPLGIDITTPRLSWELKSDQRNIQQTAYQVMVASSKEKLSKGDADYWNSGKIMSDQSIHIIYAGKKLASRATCYWKVMVTTNKGTTNSTETAFWTTGLINKNDWQAKWIGYDHGSAWDSITQFSRLSARYFRKPFQSAGAVKTATAYIVGLHLQNPVHPPALVS